MGIKLSIRGTAPALRGGAYFMVGLLACVAIGCGDDDDDKAAESCPADASAGTKISCHCGDSGVGIATCKNDGTIGACMCAGDGGSAGNGSSGSGGKSGSGAAGNSGSGGSGGSSGSNAGEDDASVSEEDGGQSEPPPASDIPTNGDQFTACARDRDCNRNLGCYSPEGGGFCSLVCDRDEDCAGLKPAGFHCGTTGVCSLACANADDDASCPKGMECAPIMAGGGGGEFRCLYPVQAPEPTGTAFAACSGGGSCMDGLECAGDNMGNAGFCTHGCTPADSDCSDVVAPSGTIAASCVPQTQNMGVCALNCEAMPTGCPDGMECVEQGFYQLCLNMN